MTTTAREDAIKVLRALEIGPHAACKLMHPTGLRRGGVDRGLRWLKRRNMVEHRGAWRLTELGRIALNVRSEATITDGDAVPRSGGTNP